MGLGTVAYVAFIARATDPRFTATQFALFTSLSAVPRTLINATTGWIVAQIGLVQFLPVVHGARAARHGTTLACCTVGSEAPRRTIADESVQVQRHRASRSRLLQPGVGGQDRAPARPPAARRVVARARPRAAAARSSRCASSSASARRWSRSTARRSCSTRRASARSGRARSASCISTTSTSATSAPIPETFHLSVMLGAGGIAGGMAGICNQLKAWTRSGGYILIGEGYWRTRPHPDYLALLGARSRRVPRPSRQRAGGRRRRAHPDARHHRQSRTSGTSTSGSTAARSSATRASSRRTPTCPRCSSASASGATATCAGAATRWALRSTCSIGPASALVDARVG